MEKANEGFQLEQPGQAANPSAQPVPENPAGTTQQVQPVAPQVDSDTLAIQDQLKKQRQSAYDKEIAEIAKAVKVLKDKGLIQSVEQMNGFNPAAPAQSQGQIQGQPTQQAAQPNVQQSPEIPSDPVIRKAFQIMESEGGKRLENTDPEFKLINGNTDDPEEFLTSVHAAAQAYNKRTGNLANPARIPTLAGGDSPHTPNYASTPGVDILEAWNRDHPL